MLSYYYLKSLSSKLSGTTREGEMILPHLEDKQTMRESLPFVVVLIGVLTAGLASQAPAQTVSGLENTSFNLSFDASSVDQIGNDNPDLRFQDVTFGAELPLTERIGLWATVSKSADFNRHAADGDRKLTGGFGAGLSYEVASRGSANFDLQGGILSRFEQVGDGDLNPVAARLSAKIGWRLLGEPGESRWFGLFIQGGLDLALRDIMSMDMTAGDIMKGDTTYHTRGGLEFSF